MDNTNRVEAYIERLNQATGIIIVVVFAAMIISVTVGVFFRYALNNSLVWAEELARYLFVWTTFLAAGLGVSRNIHVSVDMVTVKLSAPFQRRLKICVNIGATAFILIMTIFGAKLTVFGMGNRALLLGVPMGLVYSVVPVTGLVMLMNIGLNTWRLLAKKSGKQ